MRITNESGELVAEILDFTHPLVQAEDTVEALGGGVYRIIRQFRAKGQSAVPASGLHLELETAYEPEFMMIPAVSYNGNQWGDGKEPTGWEHGGQPWSFAHHRAAVAGGTFSAAPGRSLGLMGGGADMPCGFSCSLFPREGHAVHRLIAPEEEMPRSYLVKGSLSDGYRDTVWIQPDKPLALTAVAVAGAGDYREFLDRAWRMNRHEVKPRFDNRQLWELARTYAKESLWTERDGFQGFSIGLMHSPETGNWEALPGFESGWCGQNISLGCSMLYDYQLTGDEDSLRRGLGSLDAWSGAFLLSGLFCPHYDALLGITPMDGMRADSCNLGSTAENFIEAWELARACGHERPQYLSAARSILDWCRERQLPDASYPAAYRADGSVLSATGSTGGFVMPAMLWLHAVTGEDVYLSSAKRAFAFYFGEFSRHGYTTAGALDSFCIDKESAIPLLSAALMLHSATGEGGYLSAAEELAYYLSTWQWHQTVRYPAGTALGFMGYDTFGGTAVSTQHHHIDPYALRYVPYLMELAKRTGRGIWQERAEAVWGNAAQGISDGTLEVMGKRRPRGSQDEAFMHTRWGCPSGVSQWLVAWPSAFRLEVLRKTRFFTRSNMGDIRV